jgi:hypothetical protein
MNRSIRPSQAYINKDRAAQLLEKWGPVLDYTSKNVRTIEDDHTKLNTAILLENQESWCINEANVDGGTGSVFGGAYSGTGGMGGYGGAVNNATGDTNADWYATGDARLPKILIPMIRRTFPELITNEIVGVQPMSGPVGLAFALRYKYDNDTLGNGPTNGDQASGTQNAYPWQSAAAGTAGGLANNWGAFGSPVSGELGWQYLDTRFTGASSSTLAAYESNAHFAIVQEDQGVAQLLANYELTGRIPTVSISFEKTAVEAGTRRLAARWSVELEQDLKNMNGIDIDAELTNAMSYEIQAEIDREMIMRMVQVCLRAGTANGGLSFWYASAADGRWLGERNRDFYQKLIIEANRIAIRNRRGAANFIIATPRVCAILEMLPEFSWMTVDGNVSTQPVGVAKVGNVGGRFAVYRDTRTDAQNLTGRRTSTVEYALLGYKGPEFYDTGIIYCPYIPVMVQRTIGPNDFAPRVGLLTRYGVVDNIFGANLYYHLVIVKGLGTSFTPASNVTYL